MLLNSWDSRAYDVLELLIEFGKESNVNYYTGTHQQEDKAFNDIWRIYNDPDSAILLEYQDDRPAGFAIVFCDKLFTDAHGIGIVGKFYIRKECRRTHAGRNLCEQVTQWFDSVGVQDSFVTSTAGINENKQFENLFRKYGYNQVGIAMKRIKHE